jgi:membrane protein DedA with SNARE-associated domain
MRNLVTTLCELAGFACLATAGFLVAEALGFAITGASLIAIGFLAGRG